MIAGIASVLIGRRMMRWTSAALRYRRLHVHVMAIARASHRRFGLDGFACARHSRHDARRRDRSIEDHHEAEQQAYQESTYGHAVMVTDGPQLRFNDAYR